MKFLPRKVDSQFLIRVIKNEVSQEEREYFEKWLSESDSNKEEYSTLLLLWEEYGKSGLPEFPPPEEQWNKLAEKISLDNPEISRIYKMGSQSGNYRRSNSGSWIIRIAAVIVIAVLSIIGLSEYGRKDGPDKEVNTQSNIAPGIMNYEMIAHKGERVTLPLSDGSTLYLNSDSKIIYPQYFTDDAREVEIYGEAYFSISPDKNRPFKVKSGKIVTIVTGTEFNVVNRNNRVEVTVANGHVNVINEERNEKVTLAGGNKVSTNNNGKLGKPLNANLRYDLAWRENKLAFVNTQLVEIMAEIERCYNVNVIFKHDSLKTRRLTGIFETESLEQVISLINLALDVNINRQSLTVVVE